MNSFIEEISRVLYCIINIFNQVICYKCNIYGFIKYFFINQLYLLIQRFSSYTDMYVDSVKAMFF